MFFMRRDPDGFMRKWTWLISALFLTTLLHGIPIANAQVTPDVTLQCSPVAIEIDVYPGASRMGTTTCTVENPSIHYEDIGIQYTSSGLAISGPGSVSLAPGTSEEFEVTVRGELRMAEGQRQITITAEVQAVNGVPPPTYHSSQVSLLAVIKQFAMLRVECVEPLLTIDAGVEYTLEFKVYNDGNSIDNFRLEIENQADLEVAGWKITIPLVRIEIESMAPPEKIRIMIEAPADLAPIGEDASLVMGVDSQMITDNGTIENSYSVILRATSDYSLRQENITLFETASSTIVVQDFPEESALSGVTSSLPALSSTLTILSLLGAAAYANRDE
tara:strand:- start:358 stop:1353 length:996 start_codon:yes stop_codon:yes gene_type:complete